jgi:hypothetical protein
MSSAQVGAVLRHLPRITAPRNNERESGTRKKDDVAR